MTTEDSLQRAQQLLVRLETARTELEAAGDAEEAVEVLAKLTETAKAIEAELQRAAREAENNADA